MDFEKESPLLLSSTAAITRLFPDFVVWTEKALDLVVERISRDYDFFQKALVDVKHFFVYGVLAEMLENGTVESQ